MFFFGKAAAPVIRRIGAEHSAGCARIHASAFAHAWTRRDFDQLLTAAETCADGAVTARRAQLCGFILSRRAADEAEVLTIAVALDRRRHGIGGRLLAANLARLGGAGVRSVFLEVAAANVAALRLYETFAFKVVGERKAYYRAAAGPPGTALVMRRSLT